VNGIRTSTNDHDVGAGIGWHRDRPVFDTVFGLSLRSPCVLRFRQRRPGGFLRFGLDLVHAVHDHAWVAAPMIAVFLAVTAVPALGRRLRRAGLPVTPERSARFARALSLAPPATRSRVYWTARAVFVSSREEVEAFISGGLSIVPGAYSRTVRFMVPVPADKARADG